VLDSTRAHHDDIEPNPVGLKVVRGHKLPGGPGKPGYLLIGDSGLRRVVALSRFDLHDNENVVVIRGDVNFA